MRRRDKQVSEAALEPTKNPDMAFGPPDRRTGLPRRTQSAGGDCAPAIEVRMPLLILANRTSCF